MDAVIGGTEKVIESLRQVAVTMVAADPSTANDELPAQLEDLVQQYIELEQAGKEAPEINVPNQLLRLVDEGKEPAAFVDQQLTGAYTQGLANAISVDAIQELRRGLSEALHEEGEDTGHHEGTTNTTTSGDNTSGSHPATNNGTDTTALAPPQQQQQTQDTSTATSTTS